MSRWVGLTRESLSRLLRQMSPVATTITTPGVTAYAKPAGATRVHVRLWGAGGGGGSGRRGAAGSARAGGFGGSGTIMVEKMFPASELAPSVNVTNGAGGVGASAISTNDTDGSAGAAGGNTTFGSHLRALGGAGGAGGTNASVNGVTQGSITYVQSNGRTAPASTSVSANILNIGAITPFGSAFGGGPGGTGGSLSTGNAEFLGAPADFAGFAAPDLSSPTGPAAAGANGTAGSDSALPGFAGYGGGGGGPSAAATGGSGAAGGRGSGGGGGGASVNGQASGAGGNGGDGMAYIVAYFD